MQNQNSKRTEIISRVNNFIYSVDYVRNVVKTTFFKMWMSISEHPKIPTNEEEFFDNIINSKIKFYWQACNLKAWVACC